MAARMAMIAITTNSSISVNARVPGRTGSNDFMVTRYYFDTELRKVAFFEGSWNCVSIEFSSEFLLFVAARAGHPASNQTSTPAEMDSGRSQVGRKRRPQAS